MKDFIPGHCTTNLDGYDVSVVKQFAQVPNKGDRVSCRYKGNSTSLVVVQITHDFVYNAPYIVVELHKNY